MTLHAATFARVRPFPARQKCRGLRVTGERASAVRGRGQKERVREPKFFIAEESMAVAVRNVISKAKTRMSLDVLAMLKMDHREVDALFMAVSKLSERAFEQRRKLAEKICEALQVHSQFEQNVFYPPFRHRAEDHDERETVLEAFEEHAQVDTLVSEIQEMDPRDERYEAKLMVLMDNVKHHVKEEEHEMFPIAKELFEKEELVEMGKRLMDMKRRAGMKVHK
jgi:hemerythrin superfamily protein